MWRWWYVVMCDRGVLVRTAEVRFYECQDGRAELHRPEEVVPDFKI